MRASAACFTVAIALLLSAGGLRAQAGLPFRLTGEIGSFSVPRSEVYAGNCGENVSRVGGDVRTRGSAYLGLHADHLMPRGDAVDLLCLADGQSGDTVTYVIRGGVDPTRSMRAGLLAGASVGGRRMALEVEVRAGMMRGREGWSPRGEEPRSTIMPWMSRSTGLLLLNHLVIRHERGRTRLPFTEEVHLVHPDTPSPQQGEEPFTTRTRREWRGYSAWTIGFRF